MLPASVRIFVCTVPQDMRRSFDTLALVTKQVVGEDPQNGALYVYVGKRANRVSPPVLRGPRPTEITGARDQPT